MRAILAMHNIMTKTALIEADKGQNAIDLHLTDAAGNATDETVEVYFGHRIGVGNSQAVALRDGVVHTWGRNELGQLGNGTLEGSGYGEDPETSSLPARYTLEVASVVSVVTRQTFMVALQAGGTVLTWGSNGSGQLGRETASDCGSNGTSACGRTPEPVVGLTDVVAVQAGFEHTLVLHADGSVSSFGSNEFGQLGRPGDPATPAPVDYIRTLLSEIAVYQSISSYPNGRAFVTHLESLGATVNPDLQRAVGTESTVFHLTSTGQVGEAVVTIDAIIDFSNSPIGQIVYWRIQ